MGKTKTIISGKALMIALHEQLTEELYLKLLTHTIYRLRYRYGLKKSTESLKMRSYEFIQEVLSLVFLDETRKWNIEKYPDLQSFLRGAIDSHLYNSFTTTNPEIAGHEDYVFEQANRPNENIHETILGVELKTQIMQMLEIAGSDDEELLVFECFFDGIQKPSAIRKELGISESDFNKIWRRVQRKREKLKTKLSEYGY